MKVPPLDLKAQFATIEDEVRERFDAIFASQQFILGPLVAELEEKLAEFCGVNHGVGVASGSDALLLSLMALGIKEGDVVITSPFSFFSTVSAITRLGARPYFVDVDPRTLNLSPEALNAVPSDNIRAILPVHLYGQLADMEEIGCWADMREVAILEDAAQAIGASRNGHKAGAWGRLAAFSFYPTKNLGAAGDAGMIITNDDELADKLKCLRDHGAKQRYYHDEVGINSRMDAFQAAVLLSKLPHLEVWNRERCRIADRYREALADLPVQMPYVQPGNEHIYHQFVIRTDRRDELKAHLDNEGIYTAIFYPMPLHLQKCFSFLGYKEGDFPETEKAAKEVLALPIYPELREEQFDMIVEAVRDFFG